MSISGHRFRTTLFCVGTMLGFFLGLYRNRCHSNPAEKTAYGENYYDQLQATKSTQSQNTLHLQKYLKPLLIGMISSQDDPQAKLEVALDSWIPTIEGDIKVFCEKSLKLSSDAEIEVVKSILKKNKNQRKDNSFDEKSLRILRYISERHAKDYEWFIVTDDATYVDGSKLGYLLNAIDDEKACYMGNVEENKNHKISGSSHLLVVNGNGLLTLKRHGNDCFSGKMTMVDCVKKYIGNLCINFRKVSIMWQCFSHIT